MKASKKLGLLLSVAEMAFNNGADLTVELEDYHSSANRFPASSDENYSRGIILRAFHSDSNEEGDDE